MRKTLLVLGTIALSGCASVRTVDNGTLYRSGQLSSKQLEDVIRTKGIRTVVNLRGMQPDRRWYQDEQEVCDRNGVEMIDVALDTTAPERGEVAALLDAYHNAPKPILVHSWSNQGSVGLASGLYRVAVRNEAPSSARGELAWWQSSRMPIRQMSEHDRFLKEWQGERDFFETYQLAGRDELPDLRGEALAVLKPSLPARFGGSDREEGPLPPPSMDLFGQGPSSPASYSYAESGSTEPTHRPVAWFGQPVPLAD